MKAFHKVAQRVRDLENKLNVNVDPAIYVYVVRLWQPGLPEDRKGAVFMKNSHGPGIRFSNDEEAEAWILQEKKRLGLTAEDSSTIGKDERVGMPWEQMPAYKKLLEEKREQLRQEKASQQS